MAAAKVDNPFPIKPSITQYRLTYSDHRLALFVYSYIPPQSNYKLASSAMSSWYEEAP